MKADQAFQFGNFPGADEGCSVGRPPYLENLRGDYGTRAGCEYRELRQGILRG